MPVNPDSSAKEETPVQTISNSSGPQNVKSSDEILSELFGAFNAAAPPPLTVVKQEKDSSDSGSKKPKKHSKKKSKKEKKKRRSSSSDSSSSDKKRKDVKKIKKEKSDAKTTRDSGVDSKQKRRKLGKYSASDSDSDDDRKSKKKKRHSDEKNDKTKTKIKTEPVTSKLSTTCIISSMKETILKEAVGKIVDNVIDSTKLISSILPQKVKVEPSSTSTHLIKPAIKQEPLSTRVTLDQSSEKVGTQSIVTDDIPVPKLNPEDIPIPSQLSAPNPGQIPIPKDKVGTVDQQDHPLPVADVFVEDLLDSGVSAREITCKKDPKASGGKITIQNLKFSQVYEQTVKQIEEEAKRKAEKYEEGELSASSEEPARSPTPSGASSADEAPASKKEEKEVPATSKSKKHRHHHKKERHRHRDRSRDRKRSTSKENHRSRSRRERSLSRDRRRHRDRKSRSLSRTKDLRDLSRSKDLRDLIRRSRSRERRRSRSKDRRRSKSRDRKRSRSKERRKSRSRDRKKSRDRSKSKERSGDKNKSSDRKRDDSSRKDEKSKDHRNKEDRIDKRKLLEIARKNALSMLKSVTPGVVPEHTKVSLTAGGKTVNELTDFCKLLSKKDADGHESITSDESHSSGDEKEKAFHHPFQLRDRPNSIVLNIRNSVALPTRSHQEKTAEQSRQLRLQFPVSSGQQHRSSENEWLPVSPKKTEPSTSAVAEMQLALPKPPRPKRVFKDAPDPPSLDIGSIVSQRLNAIRKLQENPKDGDALSLMSSAQQHMQTWAESKQDPPGTFTGSTGVKVLTPAELSSGYQAWARKARLIQRRVGRHG